MDAYQQLITTISLTMGVAWASGINLYATIGMLGILGLTGNIILPEQLQILQDPLIIGAAVLMYAVEFFADKTPGVDTGWDTLHTFIRIPAGVMLAAGAVGAPPKRQAAGGGGASEGRQRPLTGGAIASTERDEATKALLALVRKFEAGEAAPATPRRALRTVAWLSKTMISSSNSISLATVATPPPPVQQ